MTQTAKTAPEATQAPRPRGASTSSTTPSPSDGRPRRLRGSLGVASIVFIVVAASSPLGVIGGPVPLGIAMGNGTGFPFAFVIVTAVLLLFAVGFTNATPFVKEPGAFFAYVNHGLGRGAGLGAAFAALLSYLALEAGVFGLIGPATNELLQSYGAPDIPWWVCAEAFFVVVSVLGYLKIELSGRVLAVLLLAEVAIVLALDAVVIFGGGGPEGYSTGIVDPAAIVSGAPGFAVLFAILSFTGFEATAVFRDEARDPQRTIPRATYIALILIGVFYTVSSWALITAVGDSTVVQDAGENSGTILATTTEQYLGAVGGHIVQVLFVTSLFACILSFHSIASRYFFALAGKRVLPAALGAVHGKHGSPANASIITSVVVAVLVAIAVLLGLEPINQFYTWLGGISAVGIVLLLAITSVSVLRIFRIEKHSLGRWQTFIAPGLGLIGIVLFVVIIFQNLPVLVGEDGYGPFSWGIVVLFVAAFTLGPLVAWRRRAVLGGAESAALETLDEEARTPEV